jgi:hypothetical protein
VEALGEQRRAYYEKLKLDLDKYWREVNAILEKSLDKQLIQQIARIKFNLKYDPQFRSWFEIELRVRIDFSLNSMLYRCFYQKLASLNKE